MKLTKNTDLDITYKLFKHSLGCLHFEVVQGIVCFKVIPLCPPLLYYKTVMLFPGDCHEHKNCQAIAVGGTQDEDMENKNNLMMSSFPRQTS